MLSVGGSGGVALFTLTLLKFPFACANRYKKLCCNESKREREKIMRKVNRIASHRIE